MKHKIIANTVLVLSVILLVLALYFSFVKKDNEEMFFFGYKPFIITSGSMEPKYPVNSLVVVKKVDASTLQVGDEIAFYSHLINANVFHRIVDIDDQGFVTKGDNNKNADLEIVETIDVLGKAVFYTTLTTSIIAHFNSPLHVVLYGVVPVCSLYIGVHFFVRYRKEKRGVIQ
ncbi:signal peptidase I [Erysipelothrix larvae]|nr:signal peptidase I [Erysipelothrix larvae]